MSISAIIFTFDNEFRLNIISRKIGTSGLGTNEDGCDNIKRGLNQLVI